MRRVAKAVTAAAGGLLLLALAVGPGGAAVAATMATSPCAQADALLQAGQYTGAYAAYAAVRPADADCAKQGMAAAGALQAAGQLTTVGLVSQADGEIVKAVDADPTLTLPASLLSTAAAGRAVSLAKTLNADGFHEQAVQILLFVTEAHGSIRLDPAALAILATPGESAWASIGHGFVSYTLGWEGLVFLFVLVILVVTYFPLTRRRLHLQPFTLTDADTGADAEHLRTRVREELQRLAVEHARTDKGRRLRIDIAGPYDEPLDIGAVLDFAPERLKFAGVLAGLLIRRYPRLCRPRLVTGALCADIAVRMGIATVDKTECCHVTIKHKDLGFPPVSGSAANAVAARYAQLALPAAAWVILNRYEKYTLGGTRDLDSFTKFAVGYEWQRQGRTREAEQYYTRARDADPRHSTAAAVNLARLWQQREVLTGPGAAPADQDWRDLLSRVANATRSKTSDLQWYRSRYLLSLGLADRDRSGQGGVSDQDRQQARDFAIDLAIEVVQRLKDPDESVPREFLENSQGPALALAVSQMIPSTEQVDEVITTGFIPDEVTGDDVLRELRKARVGGSVAPEVLVPYIEACPPDEEVDYNLYRYQLNRKRACQEAIAAIQAELRAASERTAETATGSTAYARRNGHSDAANGGPDEADLQRATPQRESDATGERQRALRAQLLEATSAADDASAALDRYAERLSRSADPVLRARADILVRAARSDDDSGGFGEDEPTLNRPAPPAPYAGNPGSGSVRPDRADAVSTTGSAQPAAGQVPPTRPEQIAWELRDAPDGSRNADTRPFPSNEGPYGSESDL